MDSGPRGLLFPLPSRIEQELVYLATCLSRYRTISSCRRGKGFMLFSISAAIVYKAELASARPLAPWRGFASAVTSCGEVCPPFRTIAVIA